MRRRGAVVIAALVAACGGWSVAVPSPLASAAPTPGPYRGSGDAGGFRDILPAGNGTSGTPLAPTAPPHVDDQSAMYRDLVNARATLTRPDLDRFYKDASFGVKPGDVEATLRPRGDVVIVYDRFGVPHITGDTIEAMAFGAGYAVARDRLFFMDVLRHLGKGQASAFIGLDPANLEMDAEQRRIAGYSDAELAAQADAFPRKFGAQGAQVKAMVESYVTGINQRIAEVNANPTLIPPEYPALQLVPQPYVPGDVIAIASLVGGIFGKGGGHEAENALFLSALQRKLGVVAGRRAFDDFKRRDDPDAPTTSLTPTPYQQQRRGTKGVRIVRGPLVKATEPQLSGGAAAQARLAGPATGTPRIDLGSLRSALARGQGAASNALLLSRKRSSTGRPLAVFGPQVGYFAPEILYEEELQAPGFSARGTSFVGTNLIVELGRGPDYAWSATSMGGDNVDEFVNDLCNTDGSPATMASTAYVYRGRCRPLDRRIDVDRTKPNALYPGGGATVTWTIERTVHGPVQSRAMVGKKPVVVSAERSTFGGEADSILGFLDFNTPARMSTPKRFMAAADKISYTFNWFYVNRRDVAYFGSGKFPVRAPGVDFDLPTDGGGRFDWRGFDRGMRQNPTAVNPKSGILTSWNNKPAPKFGASDEQYGYGEVHRSLSLDRAIARRLGRGNGRLDLAGLTGAMADAATVDLRATTVLPVFLRALGTPKDARLRQVKAILAAWRRSGGDRIDVNRDGIYDSPAAVAVMDDLWPILWRREFTPIVGAAALGAFPSIVDDPPNQHLGSAYNGVPFGTWTKDVRRVIGAKEAAPLSRRYCGRGRLAACRGVMVKALKEAVANVERRYGGPDPAAWRAPSKPDDIVFRAIGLQAVDDIPWQNRPTFQQVVEVGGP